MENLPPQYRRISPEFQDARQIPNEEIILLGKDTTPVSIAMQLNELLSDEDFEKLVGWVYAFWEEKTKPYP